MASRLLRGVALVVLAGAASQLIAKRLTSGDEESDEFQVAAIVGGRELTSRATALRSAKALAVFGGVELDLREATLDPAGATLDVTAVMGGIEVRVPEGWAVDVEDDVNMGGLEVDVPDAADLPPGAPRLRAKLKARMGGIEVRA